MGKIKTVLNVLIISIFFSILCIPQNELFAFAYEDEEEEEVESVKEPEKKTQQIKKLKSKPVKFIKDGNDVKAIAISPVRGELIYSARNTEEMGFDFAAGIDFQPVFENDIFGYYTLGQKMHVGMNLVLPLVDINEENISINILPGLWYGYQKSNVTSTGTPITFYQTNHKIMFVCNLEVEFVLGFVSKNLKIGCSAGVGIGVQNSIQDINVSVNGEELILEDSIIRKSVTSFIMELGSGFALNPIYLRYYF